MLEYFTGGKALPTDYDKKDAARDTDSTIKDVAHAWHTARDDAQKAGDLPERADSKDADKK